jgi:hypothetical protein
MGKQGRPSKGTRPQHTVRFPAEHYSRYQHNAEELGLSYSDYVTFVLARAHGLDLPEYITRQLGRERRVAMGA